MEWRNFLVGLVKPKIFEIFIVKSFSYEDFENIVLANT